MTRMKIDLINCMNNIIEGINKVGARYEVMENGVEEADDVQWDVPRGLSMVDIEFKIICGYLTDMLLLAHETNNEKLIELLAGLGITKEKYEQKGNDQGEEAGSQIPG